MTTSRLGISLATLLLAGCAQTLTVKVLRYDVDATQESRDKYVEARRNVRSAGKAREQVAAAQLALTRYKGCLRSLNVLVQELLPGLPESERAVAKTKRSGAIDVAFQPLEAALAKMEGQLVALPPDAPAPPFQSLPVRFSDLREQLEQASVETDPATLSKAIAQLQKLPAAALAERGKAVGVELDALLADRDVSCVPADASNLLSTLAKGTPPRASAARDAFGATLDKATVRLAAELERARTGDLVPRPYGVWQDLTDPFLMYIVAHPEGWLELVESTNVDGQGDTEYVLVFESPLDARLKTVTVDPSQVIQARLSIARKVAQAAVAATGMATTSFAVPLPTAAADPSGGTGPRADTIDFSRMTADEQLARERNAAVQRRLDGLKQDAARLHPVKDVESARRALEFLRRELEATDADPSTLL